MTPSIPTLEARVHPHQDRRNQHTKLLAFAELTIGSAFVIKGIRILKPGEKEPVVVFPAEKGKGASCERWFDIAHPCTLEARNAAIRVILDAYVRAQKSVEEIRL